MTEPRDAITLPYRVQQTTGPDSGIERDLATTTFSAIALDIPIAFMG